MDVPLSTSLLSALRPREVMHDPGAIRSTAGPKLLYPANESSGSSLQPSVVSLAPGWPS